MPARRNKARGFSLIEVLGALAVGAVMTLGLSAVISTSMEDTKGQQAAFYQAQVVAAASKYISDNYGALSGTATETSPAVVTLDMLKGDGLLADGIGGTNAFGQTPCVLILKSVRQKADGQTVTSLNALIVTEGGKPIDDLDIGSIAARSGQGGGYISLVEPAVARGAYNSWNFTASTTPKLADFLGGNCSGTAAAAGHLASSLFFEGAEQLPADYLYRSEIAGQPELNEMRTPIAMSGNALAAAGAACGSRAALAVDATTRSLLTCGTDGMWQTISTWKPPVRNYADLPASGNTAGDVRLVAALSRAFTYNGSDWVALAVDQDGNLSVPGALSADTVQASSAVLSGGTMTAQGDITSSARVVGKGVLGEWVVGKYWVEGQSLYINQTVEAGTPCNLLSPDGSGIVWATGTIKLDPNGIPLTCAWDSVFRYADGQIAKPY